MTINKQALRVPERKKHNWGQAVMRDCDFCNQWALTVKHDDGGCICASCCDSEYTSNLKVTLVTALERLDAAEKRIAELTEFLAHIKKCLVRNGEYAPLSHEEIDTLLGIRAAGIITKVGE